MSLEPLLSVPETAKILGISEANAWRLIGLGAIPSVKVGEGRRLVEPEALREYIASNRKGSAT